MPLSKNNNFYYLLYGEHIDFKLAPFDEDFIDEKRNIAHLALPRPTHISDKPFKGTNFKIMACQGKDRCHICKAKHRPVNLFPIHMRIVPLNLDEKIMDLQPSGHYAIVGCVQRLLDNGATYEDILNTTLRLRRLSKHQRPFYVCEIIDEQIIGEVEEIKETDLIITDDDLRLLEKLTASLKTGKYNNPRGSVIVTLRKHGWTEDKINMAFETVLDDEGYLKRATNGR